MGPLGHYSGKLNILSEVIYPCTYVDVKDQSLMYIMELVKRNKRPIEAAGAASCSGTGRGERGHQQKERH